MGKSARAISTRQVAETVEDLKQTLSVLRHPITTRIREMHGEDIDKAILAIKIAYGLD